jgi:multimeric flavodoxin WrbA
VVATAVEEKRPFRFIKNWQTTLSINNSLERIDAVIVGSPVYVGNMSGQVKTFFDLTRRASTRRRPQKLASWASALRKSPRSCQTGI